MGGFITFLVIVGLVAVVLEHTHRRRSVFIQRRGNDRDRARMIAELEAHRD